MPVRLVFTVMLLATTAMSAYAAPMSADDKAVLQQQCMGDFTTFCGDMSPDEGPRPRHASRRTCRSFPRMPERHPSLQSRQEGLTAVE